MVPLLQEIFGEPRGICAAHRRVEQRQMFNVYEVFASSESNVALPGTQLRVHIVLLGDVV